MKRLELERLRASLVSLDGLFLGLFLGIGLRYVDQSTEPRGHMGNPRLIDRLAEGVDSEV